MLSPRDVLTLGRGCLWRGPDRGMLGDTGDTRLPSQGALRVTTWSCWLRRLGRRWAQVTGLIYGHHSPFSSVPCGSQKEHCTLTADNARAAERESGVTSVPFCGGGVHRTDLCI